MITNAIFTSTEDFSTTWFKRFLPTSEIIDDVILEKESEKLEIGTDQLNKGVRLLIGVRQKVYWTCWIKTYM